LTRKLTDIMEAIPSETIAPMSGEMKTKLIRMVLQNARLEAPEDYVQALRELMLSAESSYILAIKFGILKEQMFERNGFPDAHLVDENNEFADMMRVFLPTPAPARGQIVPSDGLWSVKDSIKGLSKHMNFDSKVMTVGNTIYARFEATIGKFHMLDVERGRSMVMLMGSDIALSGDMIAQQLRNAKQAGAVKDVALPLDEWMEKMVAHRDQVVSLIASEWRTYMVSELSDTLADTFNFFTDSLDFYNRSYISRLLTKIDLVLRLLLRQFVRDSLKDWVEFMQSFLAPIRPRRLMAEPPSPLLSIKITTRNGKVSLEPPPEELFKAVDSLVAGIPDALKVLVGCAHEMVPCMNFEPAGLYEMPNDEPVLKSTRTVTKNIFAKCMERPWELKSAYSKFNYLLQAKVPEDFNPTEHASVRDQISKLLDAANAVEMISASTESMPLFEVKCHEVIKELTKAARGIANQMLELVNQSVETRIQELRESWEVALYTVRKIPGNEEELSNLKDYLRDVKKM
jgi:hypothetical protein